MNIDRRLYIELFKNREVNLHPNEYKELYNEIWLCEQLFKDFLTASDSTLKICCAKKIYTYIQIFNDVVIPDNYINNIIYHQQHDLVENNDGYVPQDHIIHSINLYILGVYLFFNFPAFHSKLLERPRADKKLNQCILSFIKKWRNFALYHDIGYSLEAIVDKTGKLKKHCNSTEIFNLQTFENMKSLYTIRNFSRLTTDVSIIEKYGSNFDVHQFITSCCEWIRNDTTVIKSTEIINELSDFNQSITINEISTEYGFNNLLPLLNKTKYIVIINDKLEKPIGFLLKQGKNICDYYLKKHHKLEKIEANRTKYTYQYIIKKSPNYLNAFFEYNPTHIKGFYNSLPQKYQHSFEFVSNDQQINDLIFQISDWFLSKINNSTSENFEEKYKANMADYYLNAIKKCIYNNIDITEVKKNIDRNKLPDDLNKILKKMQNQESIKKLTNEIINKTTEDYMNDNGVYYDFIDYCNTTSKSITNLLDSYELHHIEFIETNENSVKLKPFSHHSDKFFEEKLYQKILQKSKSLNINFEDLCSYKTDYTLCDHGLVSSGLFYQATVFSNYLAEICKSHPNILLTWNTEDIDTLFNSEKIDEYADVIFAILLHNIYTKKSNFNYGIEYTQKIRKNPFSYFCAFCDNLQKWKRPKQIDLSKANLPEHHFMNDDFDLLVNDDSITIVCNNYDVDSIQKNIKIAETFLSGISNIIQIKGI